MKLYVWKQTSNLIVTMADNSEEARVKASFYLVGLGLGFELQNVWEHEPEVFESEEAIVYARTGGVR